MRAVVVLGFYFQIVICRDFYVGMFKRDDLLVASDTLYKERRFHTRAVAEYGRIFKCPITYFRIVDRLGTGTGPTVQITRGGLQKKYVVLRITSSYNLPLSVNIYVGCENKYNFTRSTYIIRPTRPTKTKKTNGSEVHDKSSVKPDDDKADTPAPTEPGADTPAAEPGAEKPEESETDTTVDGAADAPTEEPTPEPDAEPEAEPNE